MSDVVHEKAPRREPAVTEDRPDHVTGPAFGVPVSEVRDWIEARSVDAAMARPKARHVR